ncbi:MAG: hypothetical protein QME81_05615 [bacterium]|nr:hypothetical protein [bacterium]
MKLTPLKLDEFKKIPISSGKWELSYNDRTHLTKDKFLLIGDIVFPNEYRSCNPAPFELNLLNYEKIIGQKDEVLSDVKKEQKEQIIKVIPKEIYAEISQILLRQSLIAPDISSNLLEKLIRDKDFCNSHKVLFVDTNSVKNGFLYWLLRLFNFSNTMVILSNATQIELQKAGEMGRPKKNQRDIKRMLYRSESILGLYMEHQITKKNNIPTEILTLPYEVLGRIVESNQTVFADRLILEELRRFCKERHLLSTDIYMVTSDERLSRFIEIENLTKDILLGFPSKISDEFSIFSVQFDTIQKKWNSCSIYQFLWDFTLTFSISKLENKDTEEVVTLHIFPPDGHRHAQDWQEWRLYIEHSIPKTPSAIGIEGTKDYSLYADNSFFAWKECGLDSLLDGINVLSRLGPTTKDTLISKSRKSTWAVETVLYAIQGMGLVKMDKEKNIHPTDLMSIFINTWKEGDLTTLNQIFRNFRPYAILLETLKEKGALPFSEKEIPEISGRKIGTKGYPSIRNWGIALGQIYLGKTDVVYGENNVSQSEFQDTLFDEVMKLGGYGTSISAPEIIDALCRNLKITPIKFESLLNQTTQKGKFIIEAQSAAGGGVIQKHYVLRKKGESPRFREITLDGGLSLGGVPSFKSLVFRRK